MIAFKDPHFLDGETGIDDLAPRSVRSRPYLTGKHHVTDSSRVVSHSQSYPQLPTSLLATFLLSFTFQDPPGLVNYYNPLLPLFADDTRNTMLSEGDFVIFLGWLRHSVTPFQGPGERVTVSMNLGLDHHGKRAEDDQA